MKLLVSAATVNEACHCLKGGADIVDVKNPQEGSLGGHSPSVIRDIAKCLDKSVALSAAIGDVPNKPGLVSQAALGLAFCGVQYVKLGLCADFTVPQAVHLVKVIVESLDKFGKKVCVVVCGYADAGINGYTLPQRIPEIVAKSGAHMAMLDTYIKGNGKGLFDYLSYADVKKFSLKAKNSGIMVSLAGNLNMDDVKLIKDGGFCDIVGIRSLACDKGRRTNSIRSSRVKLIKSLLDEK